MSSTLRYALWGERNTIENATGTLTAQNTMKFWSSKYETQVNTKIPYAIRFTLFIYIAITCDICKIRLNYTVGTERLMICFYIMSL